MVQKKTDDKKNETTEGNDKQPMWHAMTVDECAKELGLEADDIRTTGLSESDATARLEKYGYNRLSQKEKISLLMRIWKLNCSVLVGILVFVALVSLVKAITTDDSEKRTTNLIEFVLITFVVSLNTAIGIQQEGSATKAAEALKNMLSSESVVIRDGKQNKVAAELLVPGDVVVLSLGDRVPADLRMIECNNIACGEAALTGESIPIEKTPDPIVSNKKDPRQIPLGDRKNMAFSATLIAQGAGLGIVVATGDYTEIGKINQLVSQAEEKRTAVLVQIDFVSKCIAAFVIATAITVWFVAYFKVGMDKVEALSLSLICAVAMIPEGLDSIVTMTYSWSVANMAKQNAIVRRLPAVETLGSVTVICSDKTGTLTKNEMSLVAYVTSNAHYRFDTDSKDRNVTNFIRDDSYLGERAEQAKYLPARRVIRTGPSAHVHGKPGFGFSMHGISLHSVSTPSTISMRTSSMHGTSKHGINSMHGIGSMHGITSHSVASAIGDTPEYVPKPYDPTPVENGESPTESFIRQNLAGGVLCSKCSLGKDGGKDGEIGNPTEIAILRATYFSGIDIDDMKQKSPIIAEVPFSSVYKFMATIHEPNHETDGDEYHGKYIAHVKGAPDRMIKHCKYQAKAGLIGESNKEDIDMSYWIEAIAILSSHGLRCLALCRGVVEKNEIPADGQISPDFVNGRSEPWMTMVGLCAIMDPPRPECIAAIAEAHRASVRVAMITGDHKDTALAIGNQLGLVDELHSEAITGPELDAMTDEDLRFAVRRYNVFARSSPQNKIQIVKALQAQGEICSMTGDGVNDAPALKAADMGVAMGKEGTDVAREASEMILADDNFATIVVAIKEGRVVWDNLRKVLMINQPINNAQGMSVLFGIALGLEKSPLTGIQVLYCNLITAVTLGFIAAVEPGEEGIMSRKPRRVGKRLIGRYLLLRIILGTTILVFATVSTVFYVRDEYIELYAQRVAALNVLSFCAIMLALSARFEYSSALHPRVFTGNVICWWMISVMVALQIFITYTPGVNTVVFGMEGMDGYLWGIVVFWMVVTFLVMEFEKAVRRYLKGIGKDTSDREFDPMMDEDIKFLKEEEENKEEDENDKNDNMKE